MSTKEFNKYENFPEGSAGKQLFDSFNLEKDVFFKKYYSTPDLKAWDFWINNTINLAWNPSTRDQFLKSWGQRMQSFDFEKMERFYESELLNPFDEDVKKFLSFLCGDSFFEKNDVTFSDWIVSKNFINPIKNYEQNVTISEALEMEGGMNYIRLNLTSLHWWKQ